MRERQAHERIEGRGKERREEYSRKGRGGKIERQRDSEGERGEKEVYRCMGRKEDKMTERKKWQRWSV